MPDCDKDIAASAPPREDVDDLIFRADSDWSASER